MLSDVVLENGGFTLNLWQFFHGGNDDKPWDLRWFFSMIFTRILGDLKVETEDCSPGGLETCRDRRTVDMRPLAAD